MFACLVAAVLLSALPLFAQLDDSCVVSVLNRNVQVNADGSWLLPNVPANFGLVRARASCVHNGITTFGQSDLFSIASNQTVNLPHIQLGAVAAIPVSLTVQAPISPLTQAGATEQLTATASYADNSVKDVTSSTAGTQYTVSNPSIATVSADGVVTAVSSGTALIQAVNEGRQGIATIQVVIAGASNGGIPYSWILANFCPNFSQGVPCPQLTDPAFPSEDPDHDGLTNLQEFQNGTDPNNPDTDGDGLTDGQEVLLYHTNPLLFSTDGTGISDGIEVQTGTLGGSLAQKLTAALQSLEVKPSSFVLDVNTIQGQASQQLKVLGHLIDGKTTIDLTSTQEETNYSSSDLTICNFGAPDGNVFAGNNGACTITVTNNGFSAQATATVITFSPTALSFVSIPGYANGVAVNGNFAYVAAGSAGLQVVDVTSRSQPVITGSLALPGNGDDVTLVGNFAYIAADSAGLQIIDVSSPLSPVLLGSFKTQGIAWSVKVRGSTAYVAAGTSGLQVIDVTNPAQPALLGSLPLAGTSKGLDVDLSRNLVVVVGDQGLFTVSVSNPVAPTLVGSLNYGGSPQNVALNGNFAFVADSSSSLTSVDITNPTAPVLGTSTDPNLGGELYQVAISNGFALGGAINFINTGVTITDISNPPSLISRAILFFTPSATNGFRTFDKGTAIAADGSYVYLTTDQTNGTAQRPRNGVADDSRLYIGQYLALVDNKGIPPTATITAPLNGATVIAGAILPITVNAKDDVAVAAVNFLLNGQTVFTSTSAPYQFNATVPTGVSSLTIGATAIDFGANVGTAQNVVVNVIPDPGTTVVGRVVDKTQTPVAGATVTTVGGKSSTTAADGTFSISGVPTVRGSISVRAIGTVNGVSRSGTSTAVPPVPGGTTNVGTITLGGGFIVVANSNDNTATVLDPSTSPPTVVATVPTGGSFPIGASVTPDGSTALVSNFDTGSVTVIDLTTTPPSVSGTPISIGTLTESTAITSDGRFAVTADGSLFNVNVSSIAIPTATILNTLTMPATGVAITPDNGTVIVGDFDDNQFSILALSSQGTLSDTGKRVPNNGSGGPGPIAVAPDGHFALSSDLFSNSVTILKIDPVSGVTIGGSVPLCCGPWGITIAPNGAKAYVAMTNSTVAVLSIDATDNVTDAGVRISIPGGAPNTFFGTPGIAFSSDGTHAYVSNYPSGTITVLDATTDTVLGTVPVGSGPAGIGLAR